MTDRRRLAALTAAALLTLTPAAHADPSSLGDALLHLGTALLWNALGIPELGGELLDAVPLPAVGAERDAVLATVAGSNGRAGALKVLSAVGSRMVLATAAPVPYAGWSTARWGSPVWVAGRRLLVVESVRHPAPGEADCARCAQARSLFVLAGDGALQSVGSLATADLTASLRVTDRCAVLGEAYRCWTPAANVAGW